MLWIVVIVTFFFLLVLFSCELSTLVKGPVDLVSVYVCEGVARLAAVRSMFAP